jgi:hypothetical protein
MSELPVPASQDASEDQPATLIPPGPSDAANSGNTVKILSQDRMALVRDKRQGSKSLDLTGLHPAQIDRLNRSWGVRNRKGVVACWRGKASPRSAIAVQCKDCMGEALEEIGKCGDRCCPLWRYRPFQPKVGTPAAKPVAPARNE